MKSLLTAVEAGLVGAACLVLVGCASSSTGSAPPQQQLPLTLQENSSLRDEQVRENPKAFAIGTSRHQVIATMGEPNRSNFGDGEDDEVYAFHSDGSKFVNRQISRGVAMAAFTVNPRGRARTSAGSAAQITIYHVYYSSEGTVEAVRKIAIDDPTAVREDHEQDSRITE